MPLLQMARGANWQLKVLTLEHLIQPSRRNADEQNSNPAAHCTFDTGLRVISHVLDFHCKHDPHFLVEDALRLYNARPAWSRNVRFVFIRRISRYW
jgi:hypothetical protein